MRVGVFEGFAYHSVKLVFLANGNRYGVNFNTFFLSDKALYPFKVLSCPNFDPFLWRTLVYAVFALLDENAYPVLSTGLRRTYRTSRLTPCQVGVAPLHTSHYLRRYFFFFRTFPLLPGCHHLSWNEKIFHLTHFENLTELRSDYLLRFEISVASSSFLKFFIKLFYFYFIFFFLSKMFS
jgi:hypothetical protein